MGFKEEHSHTNVAIVSDSNFKEITIDNVIYALQEENPNLDVHEAKALAESYNDAQKSGLYRLHLSKEDVETTNFGWHTLFAIVNIINSNRALNYRIAFAMVSGLNEDQARGVSYYKLDRKQVEDPGFGLHTLLQLSEDTSMQDEKVLHDNEAYTEDDRLNECKAHGISIGLKREHVEHPNFGWPIIYGIHYLVNKVGVSSTQNAFGMICNYDEHQVNRLLNKEPIGNPGPSASDKKLERMKKPSNSKRAREDNGTNGDLDNKPKAKTNKGNKKVRFATNP